MEHVLWSNNRFLVLYLSFSSKLALNLIYSLKRWTEEFSVHRVLIIWLAETFKMINFQIPIQLVNI